MLTATYYFEKIHCMSLWLVVDPRHIGKVENCLSYSTSFTCVLLIAHYMAALSLMNTLFEVFLFPWSHKAVALTHSLKAPSCVVVVLQPMVWQIEITECKFLCNCFLKLNNSAQVWLVTICFALASISPGPFNEQNVLFPSIQTIECSVWGISSVLKQFFGDYSTGWWSGNILQWLKDAIGCSIEASHNHSHRGHTSNVPTSTQRV